jgi:hypothetical protein
MAKAFDSYGNVDADLPLHPSSSLLFAANILGVKELREVRPKSGAHDCRRLSAPLDPR